MSTRHPRRRRDPTSDYPRGSRGGAATRPRTKTATFGAVGSPRAQVGDLCNAVTNMDPVRNDFILAFDSLNNYIDEVRPPPGLRTKLREFMSLSEVVFREDYHRSLLERLSPGLLSVVAQHNLARVVVQLPFYVDTIKRAYNLREDMDVAIKYPHNPDDPQHDNEDE